MKYIEANALMKDLESKKLIFGMNVTVAEALKKQGDVFREAIENAPAADVVEVIRCKDSDVPHNKCLGCPNLNGMIPPPEFYCAKGRRREESKDQENKPFNDLYNAFVERSKR